MTEVAEQTSVETPVADSPVSEVVAFDGNLGEGWMEKYGVAEDLRSDQTLQTTKHIGALASQLVNAQKMIGKNTTSIPNADSPQTEWDAFHDNFRPATPDDYAYEHAEGIGEIDAEAEGAFKAFAHAEGMRPETVAKLMAMDDARIMAMREAIEMGKQRDIDQFNIDSKKEWGAAYDERIHLANRMVNENATEQNKAAVLEIMNKDVRVADFVANMASKFVEHKIIDATITQNTPQNALAKADDLRNTPGYITGELANTSPSRYKQITEEITALTEEAYPEKQ